jgi:hypothetical protein
VHRVQAAGTNGAGIAKAREAEQSPTTGHRDVVDIYVAAASMLRELQTFEQRFPFVGFV